MKLFRRKTEEEAVRQEIAVKEAAPFEGLTEAEAAARAAAGWDNRPVEPPTRTTGQIVRETLLTYFNLVFLVLALCLVSVKASILNLSFIIVVIINAVIGIVQELRSKKALIENFIAGINEVSDVMIEWHNYVAEEKEKQLVAIIKEENLKEEETRKFIDVAFRDGSVKTSGTAIDKLMPPMSRFGGGNRAEKKQSVIQKLQAFFEQFFGIG